MGIRLLPLVLLIAGCGSPENSLLVKATAYNSLPGQTQGDPTLTAWGHRLEPGMKAIAVSRDLIDLGLADGVKVTIDGLDGEFRVLDKMNARWKKKIDIYMGNDVEAAKQWGIRDVTIRWRDTESNELSDNDS